MVKQEPVRGQGGWGYEEKNIYFVLWIFVISDVSRVIA